MQTFKLLLIDASGSKVISEAERRLLAKGQWQLRVAAYTGSLPLNYPDASFNAVIWRLQKQDPLESVVQEAYRLVAATGIVLLTGTLNEQAQATVFNAARMLNSDCDMTAFIDERQLLRLQKPTEVKRDSTTLQVLDGINKNNESLLVSQSVKKIANCRKITDCPDMVIDLALYTDYALLCLYGWSPTPDRLVRRFAIIAPGSQLDVTRHIHRIARPDLAHAFPMLQNDNFGFFGLLMIAPDQMRGAALCLETLDGYVARVALQPRHVEWAESASLIRSRWSEALSELPDLFKACQQDQPRSQLGWQISELAADLMETHQASLPLAISEPAKWGFFALDRAWALGTGGLLLMGWRFDPYHLSPQIWLHAPNGQPVDITDRLFSVSRLDVAESYRSQFPDIPEQTGFICHVPAPTAPGDVRLIELRYANHPSCWCRLPDTHSPRSGLALVREILSWVPQPQRVRHRLFALFDDHLGPAINAIAPNSPPGSERIESLTFGKPPDHPRVSVLVPLYGRYDFLRHQLAQFADDPDFQSVDLLYLVDDPNILTATLELAAAVQTLFGVPFRVIHAGVNLGYAGINNLGARLARADTLLLLNSDVIPLHAGWLEILLDGLERLPDAGAVAPLLLFPEGAVQHAGMVVGDSLAFPGFLFNLHPGKGQAWNGPDTPSEQAMLTAACLLLRTADYRACGGLDEGYWIGDFEDSDLCLALRQRGKRLYLTPQAKLCHLERQSQKLGEFGDLRMLLTLCNSWRFSNKFHIDQLPDPRLRIVTQGQKP